MPLLILGAIVIIGILAYWYFGGDSSKGEEDTRRVRERYPHIFGEAADKAKGVAKDVGGGVTKAVRKRAGIYDVDYEVEEDDSADYNDNTIPFPSDAEREKRHRGIDQL